MNKKNIEEFAVSSRRQLIENLTYEANKIGITKDKIQKPDNIAEDMQTFTTSGVTNTIYGKQIEQRQQLIKEIENNGFDQVIEKIAYTWFNRIIAIRFMEINNYLPTKTRVLSSINPEKKEPDIITEALNIDLNYTTEDKKQIYQLKEENNTDELFKLLFIKQCNKLNEILPELFETIDDYTELLFNIQLSNENNIINKLIEKIPEEDFDEVEIIGWMYQYYKKKKKNEINDVIKPKQIKKYEIPCVTQLFTPEWIVRYMVDNSLGRYWIERNKDTSLEKKLKYYFKECQQNENVTKIANEIRTNNLKIEDLKFIDPCMGSGHILLYAFDIFYEIYNELGYYEKEIPYIILENNIYGLDIDDRAYQLAYFALIMKSTQYYSRFLKKDFKMNIYSIKDSSLSNELLLLIKKEDKALYEDLKYLNTVFTNAKEFGSLIQTKELNYTSLLNKFNQIKEKNKDNMLNYLLLKNNENNIKSLINQGKLLSQKYQIVVTNPPYMNKYNDTLKKFTKEKYKDYSKDLFSIFIYRNFDLCTNDGYTGFLTPIVWLTIKNYQKLREYIIENKTIISLIEMEYHTLWEIDAHVPVCSFILSNIDYKKLYNATYLSLKEFTGGIEVQNKKTLNALNNDVNYKYIKNMENFNKIPGNPIASDISEDIVHAFDEGTTLNEIAGVKQGLATGENNRFLRHWFEVDLNNLKFDYESCEETKDCKYKWVPYNKGGYYRKWYGNQDYVVNWYNDGNEMRNFKNKSGKLKSVIRNPKYYFNESLSWSKISSGSIAFRYYPRGFVFDVAGCSIFTESNKYYILGLLNSKITKNILDIISPTLNYEVGHISSIPIIFNNQYEENIENLVKENIRLSKEDWDENETSWNFKKHPLINNDDVKSSFNIYSHKKEELYLKISNNENELDNIFNNIYNCNNQIERIKTPDPNIVSNIESLVSYALGCIFGRYSLDEEGLVFAGGEFDISRYKSVIPDVDNIVPVLDEEYFNDDVVNQIVNFIKVAFSEEKLDENMDFIAESLDVSGNSSREVIRNYMIKKFYSNHISMYQKCPIYWMFDSGKQNAFKCLIYMHRYEPDLVSRIRFDYLHKTQQAIEENKKRQENIINNSENKSHIKKANKELTKLVKQLDEIKLYDQALAHVANQRIEIDLDDGVKVNYAKFQNIEVVDPKTNKTKKINLLQKL